MAIVTILLGCAIGALAGLIQLTFLGASLGQAFLTYAAMSVILPATVGCAALVIAQFGGGAEPDAPMHSDLETWQDWQTEEAMQTDRILGAAGKRGDDLGAVRHTA